MSFFKSIENSFREIEERENAKDGLLSFGVQYLDDAMLGIGKNDLILVGARSGAGKTALCCNIALANVLAGKRVHFIALEAEMYEIERRIKYQLFAKAFYDSKDEFYKLKQKLQYMNEEEKQKLAHLENIFQEKINYQNWRYGEYLKTHHTFEGAATTAFINKAQNLFTFYKTNDFNVSTFAMKVLECEDDTDLIIVDHVHYFDYDDDKENSSIKEIAKTARKLALENGKPILLVSHLRKRDRNADEACPGLEEFHGSSDLYKIATKAITLAPGYAMNTSGGGYETLIRIVKNRYDGSVTRYMAAVNYLIREGMYEKEYYIGQANQKRDGNFICLSPDDTPEWAQHINRTARDIVDVSKGKAGKKSVLA